MRPPLPTHVRLGEEVEQALDQNRPLVALESAVMTHGLPEPHNVDVAVEMERAVRARGAVPAICLVDGGELWIGATTDRAAAVARRANREKASVRDLGAVLASGVPAGLTVAATLYVAALAGIRVFATGGIGGVHLPSTSGDVSADLLQLSRSPVLTVCSGAKSVLDIPRTLEFLDTAGVPVFSYGTDRFPGFYLTESGVVTSPVWSVDEVARIAREHWDLGLTSGIVLGNPIPPEHALAPGEWDLWLAEAQRGARHEGISGKLVTPYLLDRVSTLSNGRTVQANLALLISNAAVAAEIAVVLHS